MKFTGIATELLILTFLSPVAFSQDIQWKHLSTTTCDLQIPNAGKEQTSSVVCDIDKDSINDFVISERTMAPSVVWYRRIDKGWDRYIIEADPLHIEAGSDFADIDRDGDLDILMGGDWQSNEIWWWENPCPDFDPNIPWVRHTIKSFGNNKQHDQIFGDFNGDGKPELVFWAQGDKTLYIANIPEHPADAGEWKFTPLYTYNDDSQMEQRGRYPSFKAVNEHEGLTMADIDGDGVQDIIAGGRWFRHIGNNNFTENIIDASYTFSRAAAGQLIKGGRPEVILVVGDGVAPMIMYEWKKGTWISKVLIDSVDCGHSLKILDFNSDGNLDIWNAEMRLNGGNPQAKNRLLLGDGKGNFKEMIISEGFGLHESKIADLDGDGDYDILGKPYGWDTPRLDIWLQNGTGGKVSKRLP
jgi:hypothetical protein